MAQNAAFVQRETDKREPEAGSRQAAAQISMAGTRFGLAKADRAEEDGIRSNLQKPTGKPQKEWMILSA